MHTNLTNINYFPTFHRSVTYQKQTQTHDDDNVDEASSLLTIATAAPSSSSSSSLRQDGVATTKKNGVPTMRAVIATCILLGTLAVIYSGGRSSSRSGGLSAALFLGHNQAAPVVYDPSQDFCFADNDNADKYCWYPTDNFPVGNWKGEGGHGYGDCGPVCPAPPPPTPPPTVAPVYDPKQDYCFMAQYGFGIYCWYPTDDHSSSFGNWKPVTGRALDSCGPQCPAPPPTPPPPTPPPTPSPPPSVRWNIPSMTYDYVPDQDFCFEDKDNPGKYCWYPLDSFPIGNWGGVGGRGYDQCGQPCTDVEHGHHVPNGFIG